jgi:hypothetical protein
MTSSLNRTAAVLLAVAGLTSGATPARAGFVNGDFQTGDLTGWNLFTTAGGTTGTPAVVAFNTTGAGSSLAARFQVGREPGSGVGGGGIFQFQTLVAGTYTVSADIAAFAPFENFGGGKIQLLIDGVVRDTTDFGSILGGATERNQLTATVSLSAGTHEFRFLFPRQDSNLRPAR